MVAISPLNVYTNYNYEMPQRKPIVANTSVEKLKEDVNRLDNKTVKATLGVLSPIPTFRRINSVPDSIKQDNNSRALGLLGLAALNVPADLKEIAIATEEVKNIFTAKNLKEGLKGRPYQHEIHFLKGTVLNKLATKYSFLENADKTLYNSKFGSFIQNKLKLGINYRDMGKVEDIFTKKTIAGFKFTGNYAQKTLARALHRIPVIGLAVSSTFELPTLIKSITKTKGTTIDKAKAFGKQLIKSAGYIGFTTAAISIIGAMTFPASAVLGLVGMAAGSIIGLKASNSLNKLVDQL